MKQLLFPIQLRETSARVQYLHIALAALGMPVDEKEKLSRTAGESTLKIIRGLQSNWNIKVDESVVLDAVTAATIEKELRERGILEDSCLFTVSGYVRTADGYAKSKVKLVAVDVDLRGAAIYRTVGTYAEVLENAGFELLGEAASDRNGQYDFSFYCDQFKNAERGKADVVVFAVKEDVIYGRSRMVNAADYSETGEVRDLDIIITETGTGTEYQRVMAALQSFLKESGVSLHELAASKEQIIFTASELELNRAIIDVAARAQEIIVKEDDRLSHELLYALGRMQHPLLLADLSKKSGEELTKAIETAAANNIIKQHDPREVQAFLGVLAKKTGEAALDQRSAYNKVSLDEVLSHALPQKELRTSFIQLVKDFPGEAKDFWTEFLPAQPGFKEDPKLIKNLLLTQQLTMITGNHQLLVKELQTNANLESATDLLRFTDQRWQEIIKKSGLPEELENTEANVKEYATQIRHMLDAAYPTQRIALMLENKELPVKDSLSTAIHGFLTRHENFSFTASRVFDFEKEIEDTATEDKQAVKDELLRMQRVFQVSTSPEVMTVLMKHNINSAHDIVSTPRMSFLQMYGEELGGMDTAYAVYQKAAYISNRAEMNAAALMEMSHSSIPEFAMSKGDYVAIMETIGKKIPNYTQLFGSPEICECGHCKSVFSPAAYFVDILRFLWRGVKNADGKSPLEMLVKRRPDLLYLPLTCENTDTLIPYIDLANEVMEFYTVNGSVDNFRGFDTGDASAAELRADPQHVNTEAYRKLKDTLYPFSLPYHKPLDMIRISSSHLKTGRHEVMKTMQKEFSEENKRAIEAESLKISPEEYILFTKEDFTGNPDTRAVHEFYGYGSGAQIEAMAQVPVFLERSGIQYTDLTELLKTKFINPHQHIIDLIQDVFRNSTLSPTQVYDLLKQIDDGSINPADNAALMEALTAADMTAEGFREYVQAHFTHFNEAITLYEPSSKCDLDTTVLRVLGNVYTGNTSSGIKAEDWSGIHRFIRLWKKLGWSIHEVDLMLTALGGTDITPALIGNLSAATALHNELRHPLNQLTTFWGEIDTYGTKSLYKKLFLSKTILTLDPIFAPDEWGNILRGTTGVLADHVPAILAAFKISQEDLEAILKVAVVTEGGNPRPLNLQTDKLSLPNLSILYRYTDFSKAMKFKIPECCTLLSLFNASPFSIYSVDEDQFKQVDPAATLAFYKLASSVKATGFKPAVLQYIFSGSLPAESSLGLSTAKIRQTAKIIRDAFGAIDQDHPENPSLPVTADLIRNKLALTFPDDIVTHFIDIVEGNTSFDFIAGNNLTIDIPASLAEKCSYVKASGRLTFKGIMTDAERTALKALHADGDYHNAVDRLYAIPEDFLRQHFNGVFADINAAVALFINRPAQPAPADSDRKWAHVYRHYVPLLKTRLREDAIAQHLAALTGLTEDATRLLIGADMPNLLTNLATAGASAVYYGDTSFTSEAFQRTDAAIDFRWDVSGPDASVPANAFGVRWESFLAPPATSEYTLLVGVTEPDETFRLYLDEAMILEKPAGDTTLEWEIQVPLNASELHVVRLDYIQNSGASGIRLSWKTATTAQEIVPATALFPASLITWFAGLAVKYHRAAQCVNGFGINAKELDHFTRYSANFDGIDWKTITPLHWIRMNDYVSLRKSVPLAQADLIDLFKAANTVDPAPALEELITVLVLATAWDVVNVTYLVTTHFGLGTADFKNEKALARIHKAMVIIRSSGISAAAVARWGEVQSDFDELSETAQQIKSVVKAKYEEEDWLDVAAKLSNAVRENQKQALISYLLVQPGLRAWGVRDADALFEYFLIDVQMGSCMDTSRIVQATAAVQQFVNRCLLNLESKMTGSSQKGVSPDAIDTERWEWMKNYRVWEANRKVFLYPENWLEPDWRDDRSSFFKELESELVQNDINERSVETAFRNYLSKLNDIANLEVCGMFQENDEQGKLNQVHVFGRTHNAPYQVFYRTWNKYMKWSAWEKVQADIRNVEDGDLSGVHLLPFVWKKRLFLFWAELIEKKEPTDSAKNKSAKAASESGTLGELEPRKYWETRLAWTEYVDGKWTPKQLSKEFIHQYVGIIIPTASRIKLVGNIDAANRLTINTHCEFDGAWVELGSFLLTDITSTIQTFKLVAADNPYYESKWPGYGLLFMNYKKKGKLSLLNDDYLKNSVTHKLLLSPERKNYTPKLNDPFFFSDAAKTYFVRPVNIQIFNTIRFPEYLLPVIPRFVDDSYFTNPQRVPKVGPDDLIPHGDLFRMPKDIVDARISSFEQTLPAETVVLEGAVTLRSARSGTSIAGTASDTQVISGGKNMESVTFGLKQIGTVGAAFSGFEFEIFPEKWKWNYRWDKGLEFHTFHHPHSNSYVTRLNRYGMDGLMSTDTALFFNDGGSVFINRYNPNFNSGLVQKPGDFAKRTYFKENICFDVYGANSIYNWELFFHAPMYIATRLSKNGKYKEAMDWFHYIFDPTTNAVPLPGENNISRYWKVQPFKATPAENLEDWFLNLQPNSNPATENMIVGEWADKPFMPHLVARNRPIAYMKHVVIKYVENLLDWADSLFRQFTRESVNEALQIYVIANHILGPRPQFVPKRGKIKAETYSSLQAKLDDFSNAIVQLENLFPYSSDVPATAESTGPNILGVGESLYFCIPSNEKLMECWDRAADRLFKIRHCMDINGVERQLALFAPPIDPAALIQAASQGLSLGSILADLSSPPPIYRFTFLLQKANEFCAEVKFLGNALLTALEKKDNETIGRMRSTHERSMLELITGIRERQVLEAKASRATLEKARETAQFRMEHYNDLLGNEAVTVPAVATLPAEIGSESTLPPDSSLPVLVPDVDQSLVESGESGVKLISKEKQELDLGLASMIVQQVATGIEGIAGTMNFIPTFSAEIEPFGCGMSMSFGGSNIAGGMSGIAKLPMGISALLGYMANHSAKMANYIRREQEWTFQANMALKEIVLLEKQITAADIRIQVAEKELDNHLRQIENAKQVELFLQSKFTNQELYQWMKEQLFAVYKQSYNMCYDLAKKAEKAYRYETGNELASFIQYGYWDNSYQGLLAGEKMQLALRQLEKSYIEENKRDLELRKNVSLAFTNPLALQELRQTGRCFVSLPEELFDLDFQGHYFRRIKAVSLSIPCIAGPMTTISCSLRLVKNTVRINTSMSEDGKYEHMNDEGIWIDDDRFRSSNVPVQAIAVSHAQNDTGLFELNFRDERYLPFEGGGVISEWKIELTADEDLRQFDYNTISDVVMHLNYTAREDAGLFKNKAVESIKDFLTNAAENSKQPLVRMFSVRHEFPSDWHSFLYPSAGTDDQQIRLQLKREHFPFFARNRNVDVMKVEVLARARKTGDYHLLFSAVDTGGDPLNATQLAMPQNDTYGGMQKLTMSGTVGGISIEDIDAFAPVGIKLKHNSAVDFKSLETDPEEMQDVFLAIHYKLSD